MGPGNGRIYADANAWADRALALNPAAPGWYMLAKGTAAFAAGDYPAVIAAMRAAPQDFPERPLFIAAAAALLGDAETATSAVQDLRRIAPDFAIAAWMAGQAYLPDGDFEGRLREGAVRAGLGATPLASGG
jgi:hypothetical protein